MIQRKSMVKEILQVENTAAIDPAQSILLLELGEHHMVQGIFDKATRQINHAAFYYADHHALSFGQLLEEQPELHKPYFQTLVSYQFPESILVPEKFYAFEEAGHLLDQLYGTQPSMAVMADHLVAENIRHIYRVPLALSATVNGQYSAAKTMHAYTAGIAGINHREDELPQLVVNFTPQQIIVYVIKHNIVQLVQNYFYTTPADVLYYLIKICSNLGILQQDVQVTLQGLIDAESAVYKKLYEYFLHITFAGVPPDIRLHESLSKHPVHFYATLIKLAQCES